MFTKVFMFRHQLFGRNIVQCAVVQALAGTWAGRDLNRLCCMQALLVLPAAIAVGAGVKVLPCAGVLLAACLLQVSQGQDRGNMLGATVRLSGGGCLC